MMTFGLGANGQYIMKITKTDGTVVSVNADDVACVTFEQEQGGIAGIYEGWTSASATYFQGMLNKGDHAVITENSDGTVNLTYTSQTWGTSVFTNVAVNEDGEKYSLAETGGTIALAGHGGVNNYDAVLQSGTVMKQTGACTIVVKAPSVMYGTTMTFSTENMPVSLVVTGTYEGWTCASATYFSEMNNDGDKAEIAAASETTADVTYTSAIWGTATFKGVSISQTDGSYILTSGTESTILMPVMGNEPKEYACTLEEGSISDDLLTYCFVFKAPAVMGGTTITFRQGTAPSEGRGQEN